MHASRLNGAIKRLQRLGIVGDYMFEVIWLKLPTRQCSLLVFSSSFSSLLPSALDNHRLPPALSW